MDKITELYRNLSAPSHKNSYLISFEGIEGSGKSTQINYLKDHFEAQNYRVLLLREPGGTDFGEGLRSQILNSSVPINPIAEAYLFASSRAQLLSEKVLPFLEQQKSIVILDRFIDSSLAYQGIARDIGFEKILKIHQFPPLNTIPHITFYLKIDLKTSFERQKSRGSEKDYFEKENAKFYGQLVEGYDTSAKYFPERVIVIDASKTVEEVSLDIRTKVSDKIS